MTASAVNSPRSVFAKATASGRAESEMPSAQDAMRERTSSSHVGKGPRDVPAPTHRLQPELAAAEARTDSILLPVRPNFAMGAFLLLCQSTQRLKRHALRDGPQLSSSITSAIEAARMARSRRAGSFSAKMRLRTSAGGTIALSQ